MEEKINLYLTKNIYQLLENDMESFGFIDSNNKPLRNSFINTVIVNYFEEYETKLNKNIEDVSELISKHLPKSEKIDYTLLTSQLKDVLNKNNTSKQKEKKICFALKPTKYSSKAISSINNFYLKFDSLSGYLRNLLFSYTTLSRVERELIVFKPSLLEINKAIKEDKKLLVTMKKSRNTYAVCPYKMMQDKTGIHNYLLVYGSDNHPYSFRLQNMINLHCTNEKQDKIPKEIVSQLEKAYVDKTSFINKNTKSDDIIVKFTDNGFSQLNTIEINRPNYELIDKNKVVFDCSVIQAFFYLRPFGTDAEVISPPELKKDLATFYSNAAKSYGKH